jgi:hypothetical protein
MRWMTLVENMGNYSYKTAYRVLVRKPEIKRGLGRPSVSGRILGLLKLISKEWDRRLLTGFMWLRTGTNGELL